MAHKTQKKTKEAMRNDRLRVRVYFNTGERTHRSVRDYNRAESKRDLSDMIQESEHDGR